jgi:serine/threonine protein kinase
MILQVGYNKSIDFWALGILIYELTTGETPFKLEDVSTKLRFKRIAIEEETNRKWRGHRMNPATTDIVGELLRFNPDDRLGMKGW